MMYWVTYAVISVLSFFGASLAFNAVLNADRWGFGVGVALIFAAIFFIRIYRH